MNEMRKLMEALNALDEVRDPRGPKEDYENWGFSGVESIASEFESDLEKLLNDYWANAEHASDDPQEIEAIQQRLETILRSFVSKDVNPDEAVALGEGASSKEWEIAINNLIAEGDELWRERDAPPAQTEVWEWVSSELHGMLDFQPDNESDQDHFLDGGWLNQR